MEAALSELLVGGPLEIRPHEQAATLNGRALRLTRHEFGLLIALASRPGAVLGRQELAQQAWGRPLRTHDPEISIASPLARCQLVRIIISCRETTERL